MVYEILLLGGLSSGKTYAAPDAPITKEVLSMSGNIYKDFKLRVDYYHRSYLIPYDEKNNIPGFAVYALKETRINDIEETVQTYRVPS